MAEAKETFKFFVPAEIEKAKDAEGKEAMTIGGIASTNDKDTDEEFLDPSGFELGHFLNQGFLNWNHRSKDDPSAIVGEPTEAKIREDGLYIKGDLYKDSDKAKNIYNLAKTLQKSGSGRRLGFSIEGKVLERDPSDEKKIKRALITGCAITPTPKNHNTIMDVIKGEHTDQEEETFDYDEANGGESNLIVDVTDPDEGVRKTVDKNFNIKIEPINKVMDTGATSPLAKESVEGAPKRLTKSEAFGYIFRDLEVNDISKAKEIYNIFETIEKRDNDMADNKISEESIKKAKESLGLETEGTSEGSGEGEGQEQVNKGEGTGEGGEQTSGEGEGGEQVNKGEGEGKKEGEEEGKNKDGEEEEDEITKMERDISEKQEKLKQMKQAKDNSYDKTQGSDKMGGNKAAEPSKESKFNKSDIDEISKAVSDEVSGKIKALGELVVAQEDQKKELEEKLQKAEEANQEIQKSLDQISERVGVVEDTSQGRKSITTSDYAERFNKGEGESGAKTFSISQNKGELMDYMFSKAYQNDQIVDEDFAKAVTALEAGTDTLQKSVIGKLEQDGVKVTN